MADGSVPAALRLTSLGAQHAAGVPRAGTMPLIRLLRALWFRTGVPLTGGEVLALIPRSSASGSLKHCPPRSTFRRTAGSPRNVAASNIESVIRHAHHPAAAQDQRGPRMSALPGS